MSEAWTVLKVLNWTKGYLAEKGVENARLEAEWLLAAVTGLDRVGLYVNFEKPLSEAMATPYSMVQRLFGSEDAIEGPRAFAEKRKPVWRGR